MELSKVFSSSARVFKDVSKSLKEQAQEFMSNDTPLEKQLKEATSNENWGCPTTILGEIARAANDYHDYNVIMRHVWEQLARSSKYWRRVFKALTLLEYLIRHGPERVVDETRDCLYRLRSLSGFHYTDDGKDRGGGVRDKAKQIIELVSDTELLRAEREKARLNRDRYVGIGAHGEMSGHIGGGDYSSSGFGNSDYPSSGARGTLGRAGGSAETRADQDAAKEQRRIAAEREKARLQRERQREKTLKKQSSQEKPPRIARRGSKKSTESYSSSDDSSGSSSEDSTQRTRHKKVPEKKSSAKTAPNNDFFNTDVGWGSGSSNNVAAPSSSGFGSGFDAFPPPPPPPHQQSTQAPPFPAPRSAASSMSFPSQSIAPAAMQQPHPNQQVQQFPDFFATPTSSNQFGSTSSMGSTHMMQPQTQAQFPSTASSFAMAAPQQHPPSVQSLMAQNLANLSAMPSSSISGQQQQASRNPFGLM